MKPSKLHLASLLLMSISLAALPTQAVTMSDNVTVTGSQTKAESVKRGKLIKRYAEGKIETSKGTFYTSGVEVVDNRPIDDWYKSNQEAEVSLYFRDKRLIRAIIY